MPAGQQIANIRPSPYARSMATLTIFLPESLKSFVDAQVSEGGYSSGSEYVRELIRQDRDRQRLRSTLLEGAALSLGAPVDDTYFNRLQERVHS